MTATLSGAEAAARGWVPRGGCPFERGTTYSARATQDATAPIGLRVGACQLAVAFL